MSHHWVQVGGPAAGEAAAGGEGAVHSTPSDMLAVLRQQLEEKDRTIAELRVGGARAGLDDVCMRACGRGGGGVGGQPCVVSGLGLGLLLSCGEAGGAARVA